MLIKQIYQKNVTFVTIDVLKILVLNMNLILVMGVMIECKKAMGFNNIAIVYIKRSSFRIHFWYISKDDAINMMNGSSLVDKRGIL